MSLNKYLFVYFKIGEHDKALELIIYKLNDHDGAIDYCISNSNNSRQLKKKLFSKLLSSYMLKLEKLYYDDYQFKIKINRLTNILEISWIFQQL